MGSRKSKSYTDIFSLRPIFKRGPGGSKNLLIIAHRDLDGLISAFLLAKAVNCEYGRVDVLFSQPYLSDQLRRYIATYCKSDTYKHLAMVDLSVDYVNPMNTCNLFSTIKGRLRFLFDHHSGWDRLLSSKDSSNFNILIEGEYHTYNKKNEKYIILGEEPCCANLVFNFFNLESKKDTYLDDILRLAIISDDLNFRKDMEGTDLYKEFIKLKNMTIEGALNTLKQCKSIKEFEKPEVNWYSRDTKQAKKLLPNMKEVYPGIGYMWSFSTSKINYTALCEQAYKKYKIIIVKELDARNLKLTFTVAHSIPDLDLVRVFKLKGGNSRRVTVCKKGLTVEELVEKLKPYLKEEIVC